MLLVKLGPCTAVSTGEKGKNFMSVLLSSQPLIVGLLPQALVQSNLPNKRIAGILNQWELLLVSYRYKCKTMNCLIESVKWNSFEGQPDWP